MQSFANTSLHIILGKTDEVSERYGQMTLRGNRIALPVAFSLAKLDYMAPYVVIHVRFTHDTSETKYRPSSGFYVLFGNGSSARHHRDRQGVVNSFPGCVGKLTLQGDAITERSGF